MQRYKKSLMNGIIQNIQDDKYIVSLKTSNVKISRENIIATNSQNLYQIVFIYKKVSNFSNLALIQKRIKYLQEKQVSDSNVTKILVNEFNKTATDITAILEEYNRTKKVLKINTGIRIILDFKNQLQYKDGKNKYTNVDIYMENVTNMIHTKDINTLIKTMIFTYAAHYYNSNIINGELQKLKDLGNKQYKFSPNMWSSIKIIDESDGSEENKYFYDPKYIKKEKDMKKKQNVLTFTHPFKQFEEMAKIKKQQNRLDAMRQIMEGENDTDENDDIITEDNYKYLLENVKIIREKDPRLFKLRKYEPLFEEQQTWAKGCQKKRYPILLTPFEFKKIQDREAFINIHNKRMIFKHESELHFYSNEKVHYKNESKQRMLVTLHTVLKEQQTATFKKPAAMKDVAESTNGGGGGGDGGGGGGGKKTDPKSILSVGFKDIEKLLQYHDDVYYKSDLHSDSKSGKKSKKDESSLIHCIVKGEYLSMTDTPFNWNNIITASTTNEKNVKMRVLGINSKLQKIYYTEPENMTSPKLPELKFPIDIKAYSYNKTSTLIYDEDEKRINTSISTMAIAQRKLKDIPIADWTYILLIYNSNNEYLIAKRDQLFKFDYINSLGEGEECEVDIFDETAKGTGKICRSIVLNNNHYVCPKLVDINTWLTLDEKDPGIQYNNNPLNTNQKEPHKNGLRFISHSIETSKENRFSGQKLNLWTKDIDNKNFKDYNPTFIHNQQEYKLIDSNNSIMSTNSIYVNETSNLYPNMLKNEKLKLV